MFQLVYTEAVMENPPPSMFLMKVRASDPDIGANGQVTYSLHGPNADMFRLDQRTGMLGLFLWGQITWAHVKCLSSIGTELKHISVLR